GRDTLLPPYLSRRSGAQLARDAGEAFSETASLGAIAIVDARRFAPRHRLRAERSEAFFVDAADDRETHRQKCGDGGHPRHFLPVGRASSGAESRRRPALSVSRARLSQRLPHAVDEALGFRREISPLHRSEEHTSELQS